MVQFHHLPKVPWPVPDKRAYRIVACDQVENLDPIFLSWLFHSSDCGILSGWGCLMEVDKEKVDDMVLALLYLTTFEDKPRLRAWKGHNWDALDRLHRKDYISDPAMKAKSVLLTDAGAKRSQELFEKYFAK
jgi:Domain of unknown function (DUF6429)